MSKNTFEPNFFEILRLSIYGMWFTNEVNVYVTFTWCMSIFLWGRMFVMQFGEYLIVGKQSMLL